MTIPNNSNEPTISLLSGAIIKFFGSLNVWMVTEEGIDETLLSGARDAYLSLVDIIERRLGITPRTAEIRQWYKEQNRNGR